MNLENLTILSKSNLSRAPTPMGMPLFPPFHQTPQRVPVFPHGREVLGFPSLSWISLWGHHCPPLAFLLLSSHLPGKAASQSGEPWPPTWWQLLELQAWNEKKYLMTCEIRYSGKWQTNLAYSAAASLNSCRRDTQPAFAACGHFRDYFMASSLHTDVASRLLRAKKKKKTA